MILELKSDPMLYWCFPSVWAIAKGGPSIEDACVCIAIYLWLHT